GAQGAVKLLLAIVTLMAVSALPLLPAWDQFRKFVLPKIESTMVNNSPIAIFLRIEGVTLFVLVVFMVILTWRSGS
ncbi:MAG: hypothetical protein ACRDN0_23200, partial [Trebonia sp.]